MNEIPGLPMKALKNVHAYSSSSPLRLLKGGLVAASLMLANAASAADPSADEQTADQASDEGEQEVVITEKARAHFRAGVNLLQDPEGGRYEEAYQQFTAAYDESPSWKILGNLGLSAMHLERYGEAIDAFTEYLDKGGDNLSVEERQQFARDLETLQTSVAYLEITAPAGTNLTDVRSGNRGADVKNYYVVPESGALTLGVRPGQHQVTAESAGQSLGTWKIRIESQKSESYEFTVASAVTPPPRDETSAPASHPYRIPGYVSLGVGAAGIGVGAAFLAVYGGQTKKGNEVYDECKVSGTCGSRERTIVEDHDEKAAMAGTVSLISFGVGVVGVGAGVTLLLLEGPVAGGESPLEAKIGSLTFSAYADARQIGLFGSF